MHHWFQTNISLTPFGAFDVPILKWRINILWRETFVMVNFSLPLEVSILITSKWYILPWCVDKCLKINQKFEFERWIHVFLVVNIYRMTSNFLFKLLMPCSKVITFSVILSMLKCCNFWSRNIHAKKSSFKVVKFAKDILKNVYYSQKRSFPGFK